MRTLRAWQEAPIEELLDLLEAGSGGDSFILDTLYYARSAALSPAHLERLNAIAPNLNFRSGGGRDADMAECYLTVIEDNPSRFFRYWDLLRVNKTQSPHHEVMLAAGDLQIDRKDVLNYLVGQVARNGLMRFFHQFDAMLALGKIGQAAGEAAAATIEQHIYESSDSVASVRRLAIARIRSPRDDWRRCDMCFRGKVLNTIGGGLGLAFVPCSRCFGLGHVAVRE